MASSRVPKIVLDDVMGIVASRTPGPLGINDQGDPNVRALRGDTPGPLGINDHSDPGHRNARVSTEGNWDPVAAVVYLKDITNGWAGKRSKSRCARAIRLALNAGHVATPKNPISAADYKDYLPSIGFRSVKLDGYTPKVGDVAVFPAVAGNIHGHIEMFTGDGWQSDYIQDRKSTDGKYGRGFFANSTWSSKPFTIFRK